MSAAAQLAQWDIMIRHSLQADHHPAPVCCAYGLSGLQEFRPVTVEELEGRRRRDIEEALIKRDIKRQKMQEAHDAPGQLAKQAELNDPMMVRRRGRMMLPAPQVGAQGREERKHGRTCSWQYVQHRVQR
jgi:hypothetical protein